MAWNEPGGNKQDPWGNRNDKGPPDLDEIFKNVQSKVSGIFGKRGGSGSGGSLGAGGVLLILLVLALITLGTSVFTLQEPERGVVTYFGEYRRTAEPGINFKIPWFIEKVEVVNVDLNRAYHLSKQSMLTQDENIVEIDVGVQYNVKNAEDFVFKVKNPDETLAQVVDSAIREVVGKNDMDFIIQEGREAIANNTMTIVQTILDSYSAGIAVTSVNMESAQPPKDVQEAFSDANKAREDKERVINEAEAYRQDILPKARGDAQRMQEEAKGYRTRVVKTAEGDAERFSALLTEYQKAPQVTRMRMYLDAVEAVLASSSKVMVDVEGGNNLMYLPLDSLLRNQSGGLLPRDLGESVLGAGNDANATNNNGSTLGGRRSREERQ